MRDVILAVGSERDKCAADPVWEAFFATVSYRLEPNGWGTRYPLLMGQLHTGFLLPEHAAAAVTELKSVAEQLQALPPSQAVWSFHDLRRIDDSALPVNHSATDLRSYFVTPAGDPMVTHLMQAAQYSHDEKKILRATTAKFRDERKRGLGLLLFGAVWTIVGYLYFREWVFAPFAAPSTPQFGLSIWPFGIVFAIPGLALAIATAFPRIRWWAATHQKLSVTLFVLLMAACTIYAWR